MSRRVVAVTTAFAFAGLVLSYLVYTSELAAELRRDAAAFSRIYYRVVQSAASPEGWTAEAEFGLLGELYALQVPVVLTDTLGEPNGQPANLPFEVDPESSEGSERLRAYAEQLDVRNPPIRLPGADVVIHYGEPLFLRRLKWIPWLQAALLLGVVGAGAWMIRTSFRGERERIWSAMARESAHQMGTPLSSLVGWLEVLGVGPGPAGVEVRPAPGREAAVEPAPPDPAVLREMATDVSRLLKVSRRFELIGRPPALAPVDLSDVLLRLGRYFEARLPRLGGRVRLEMEVRPGEARVRGNETLLEWAFENLIKNAVDALAGREGWIRVSFLGSADGRAAYRVADSGPGVPASLGERAFELGVSGKEGGWGVGLSLARRIIRHMHGGDIRLESPSEGASFRIEIPLAAERAR